MIFGNLWTLEFDDVESGKLERQYNEDISEF